MRYGDVIKAVCLQLFFSRKTNGNDFFCTAKRIVFKKTTHVGWACKNVGIGLYVFCKNFFCKICLNIYNRRFRKRFLHRLQTHIRNRKQHFFVGRKLIEKLFSYFYGFAIANKMYVFHKRLQRFGGATSNGCIFFRNIFYVLRKKSVNSIFRREKYPIVVVG
jgi:hypothetical protein